MFLFFLPSAQTHFVHSVKRCYQKSLKGMMCKDCLRTHTKQKFKSYLVIISIKRIAQLNGHVEGVAAPNDQGRIALVENVVFVGAMFFGIVTLKHFHANDIIWLTCAKKNKTLTKLIKHLLLSHCRVQLMHWTNYNYSNLWSCMTLRARYIANKFDKNKQN